MNGDFTSLKSAMASSAASSSAAPSRAPRTGSAAMTSSQLLAWPRSVNSEAASVVKTSTTCGSNWVPRRAAATAIAASVPPARW